MNLECVVTNLQRIFFPHERGQVKVTYCQRKVFCDKVAELIRAGFTENDTIDKIYRAYGERLPVSAILTKMILDRRNRGHPSLHICAE